MLVPRRWGRETRLKTDWNETVSVYRAGPLVGAGPLHWAMAYSLEIDWRNSS